MIESLIKLVLKFKLGLIIKLKKVKFRKLIIIETKK